MVHEFLMGKSQNWGNGARISDKKDLSWVTVHTHQDTKNTSHQNFLNLTVCTIRSVLLFKSNFSLTYYNKINNNNKGSETDKRE